MHLAEPSPPGSGVALVLGENCFVTVRRCCLPLRKAKIPHTDITSAVLVRGVLFLKLRVSARSASFRCRRQEQGGEWKKTHMESTPQVLRSIFLHVGSLGSKAPSGDVDSGLLAGFLAWTRGMRCHLLLSWKKRSSVRPLDEKTFPECLNCRIK